MRKSFMEDIKTNKSNYLSANPINKHDVKRKRIRGIYVYEKFYLIDFLNIKKDSYVISSFGRIFSLINNIELKSYPDPRKSGYGTIILVNEDGTKSKYVISRLIANAFIPKTKNDIELGRIYVHHKNWDNTYNYDWNLEWRSPAEINLMTFLQNDKDMDENKVARIVCILLEKGTPVAEIFDIIDRRFSKYKISRIKNRKIFRDVSEDFNF